ncbi:MAG: polysaccharide biosynthesis protein [Roseiflexus sp.]|nr:polysaccharide biosynthesis protein [Roseiflexus sp.]MCS7289780.1 polysaccharide biosynthesis protein [Roseiflexus sp.]MDW8145737.1 nucleoside-diphosphate sugar epimerase/dehydratase [Roseiflexaceae bacterium]MDW8232505.1 nucleoside-diphosphate sugar epimerase/dehydratase [Roseiflexaceae bacterium]
MQRSTPAFYIYGIDVLALIIAAFIGYALRLERLNLGEYWASFALFAGAAVIVVPSIFAVTGVYAQYWRYASLYEFSLLAFALALAGIILESLAIFSRVLIGTLPVVPLSVPLIFLMPALALTALPRLSAHARFHPSPPRHTRYGNNRVLIMGAGEAGAMIVQSMRTARRNTVVVGFVDDNPRKRGVRINGVTVLGNRHDIPHLVANHNINEVIIAMPSAPGKTIREIVAICEHAGVRAKIIPGLAELVDGRFSVNHIRDVQIEDLLRREPIKTDMQAVSALIRGRRVMVTGGGGSIGSEICRHVLRYEPSDLIILGHGENSVFAIHNELQQWLNDARNQPDPTINGSGAARGKTLLHTVIADIRFTERIHSIFEQYRPEIVFHAAAHKHVPLMEANPVEAVTNNVLGTRNLLDASIVTGVERFVMISTDKAVNPTSIMGSSKRAAELLVHHAAKLSGRAFMAVRFGNVLGSRGSVVWTFKQQIAAGGPVTVTHPEMRRYFMTIPEAVQLVLQAAVLGRGGEVFTLDMGEPVKILDLARDMIELSGLQVGRDIDIAFIGLRPGEKLFEELFLPGEQYDRTSHDKIFIARHASRLVPPDVLALIADLEEAALSDDAQRTVRLLRLIVQRSQSALHEMPREDQPLPELRALAVGGV